MRLSLPTLSLTLLTACAMLPPPGKIAMGDVKFVVRDVKLKNGLRVIVEEDHASDKAAIVAIVGAGASSDPVGKEGLAHFVEHLAYRARPDQKLTAAQMYEFAGASDTNASTWLDDTRFHAFGPKEALPALISILGAQLAGPMAGVGADAFEVEKAVVVNELRLKAETRIAGQTMAWLQEAAFPPGHRYARPVVGTAHSLASITPADAQKFVDQHYRPTNITIQIIGDFDAKKADALIDALPPALTESTPAAATFFTGRVPKEVKEPPGSTAPQLVKKRAAGIEEPELDIVWSLPTGWSDDAAVHEFVRLAVSNAVLGGETWRDDDIRHVGAGVIPGVEASLLRMQVHLKRGSHPERSLERVLDQLMNVWGGGSSNRVVVAARLESLMEASIGAEDLVTRGYERASVAHYLGNPAAYGKRLADLGKVDFARVISFAEKYVTRERARAVYLEPLPFAERPPVLATGVGTRLAKDTTPVVQYPKEEVLRLARQPSLASARRFTLENGLEVLIVRRASLPLVTVALGLQGGHLDAEPPGAGELADALGDPSNTIHGFAWEFGVDDLLGTRDHAHLLKLQGANGNLANLLALVSDRVRSMRVESGRVETFERDTLPWLVELDQNARDVLARKVQARLYPGHRFGQVATAAEYGKLGRSDLNGWLDTVYQPVGARLVVVGDVVPADAEALVRSWLGGWSRGPERVKRAAPALPTAPGVELAARPGATQNEVILACRLPAGGGKTWVANELLAAMLEVRLEAQLRRQLGATYGVSSWTSGGPDGVAELHVTTALAAEDQERAFDVLRKTWTGLGADGWDLTEIDAARWELARRSSLWARTPSDYALSLVTSWMDGVDPADVEAFPQTLVGVSDVELEEAWKVCAPSTVLAVIGDPAVAGALAKTGWTPK